MMQRDGQCVNVNELVTCPCEMWTLAASCNHLTSPFRKMPRLPHANGRLPNEIASAR